MRNGNPFIDLKQLKPGDFIKTSGKFRSGSGFVAVEIERESPSKEIVMKGILQRVDFQKRSLKLFDEYLSIPDPIFIKDSKGETCGFEQMLPGTLLSIKGSFDETCGFIVKKIKMKETLAFNVEEIQGLIQSADPVRNRIMVNNIPILIST